MMPDSDHGSSDCSTLTHVEENPVSPKDVLATAFYLPGIDPESTFRDLEGRLLPITGAGRFRPELLG